MPGNDITRPAAPRTCYFRMAWNSDFQRLCRMCVGEAGAERKRFKQMLRAAGAPPKTRPTTSAVNFGLIRLIVFEILPSLQWLGGAWTDPSTVL